MSQKLKLWLAIAIGVTILLGVVFVLFFYKARLTIVPTPASATVLVNGQPTDTGRAVKLPPGSYTLTIRADGYLEEQRAVKLGVSQIVTLPVELRAIPGPELFATGAEFTALTPDGKSILYLGNNRRQFFKVDTELKTDGKPRVTPISNERFSGLTDVIWSPNRELVLLRTEDGKTRLFDFNRYDLLHQEERELDQDLRSVTWHPTAKQIIGFHAPATGERTLLRRDLESGEVTKLTDLRPLNLTNPKLAWSANGRYVSLVEQAVYLFDMNTKNVTKVEGTDGASDALWHPTQAQLAVELENGLSLLDVTGELASLALRTAVKKATWLPNGKELLTASSTDSSRDKLQAMDPQTKTKIIYSYMAEQATTMEELTAETTGTYLWFTSDNQLYRLKLEPETN